MRRWHVLIEPTVPILLLASIVHVVRQNFVDLAVFGGTAVLIIVDAWRQGRAPRRSRPAASGNAGAAGGGGGSGGDGRRTDDGGSGGDAGSGNDGGSGAMRASRGWAAAVAALAVITAVLPYAGLAVRVLVIVIGVAIAGMVLLRPPPAEPAVGAGAVPAARRDATDARAAARGWPVWAIIGVLACLWELTAFSFQQADPAAETAHPTVSDLVEPLLVPWVGRLIFTLLWGAAGVWLIRNLLAHGAGPSGRRGAVSPAPVDAAGRAETDGDADGVESGDAERRARPPRLPRRAEGAPR